MSKFRGNKSLGKAICSICGREFQKTNSNHQFCSVECAKIAKKETQRLRTLRKHGAVKYDSVLDMETWEWKKIERDQ